MIAREQRFAGTQTGGAAPDVAPALLRDIHGQHATILAHTFGEHPCEETGPGSDISHRLTCLDLASSDDLFPVGVDLAAFDLKADFKLLDVGIAERVIDCRERLAKSRLSRMSCVAVARRALTRDQTIRKAGKMQRQQELSWRWSKELAGLSLPAASNFQWDILTNQGWT